MESEKVKLAAAITAINHHEKKKKQSRKRRHWVTPMLRNRSLYTGTQLLNDMYAANIGQFENFCRMSCEDFQILLNLIEPEIRKQDTNYRDSIPLKERLAITLRFLATEDSFTSLMYLFKISKQSISTIVIEVCQALNKALKHQIQMPSTTEGWMQCAKEFEEQWIFPYCLAAVNEKHVMLRAPMAKNTRKSFIFFGKKSLPGREKSVLYVILDDKAFALHENVMKPYSGVYYNGSKERIFNYRLSGARRIAENAFGILSSVFKVFRKPMLLEPTKARDIVLTTIYLHNFLRKSKNSTNTYAPMGTFNRELSDGTLAEGTWRGNNINQNSMCDLKKIPRKSSSDAQAIRGEFAEYVITNGSVLWQNQLA